MTTPQYVCRDLRRREAVRAHADLNGIDYLEVLDQDAPAGSPRQQTLLVRCLKPVPAGLDANDVTIEGGVRITSIRSVWVGIAADAAALHAAGLINDGERDYLLALPAPDHLLAVRTSASGDYSTYRLRLAASGGLDPLADFDEILSEVDFSFKVECPSDFDCKVTDDCPPEVLSEPALDYLAKDYLSFRQLLLDRLAVIMPQWRERNAADLGITLVELLAYAGDRLSYFQDAVATEAYLGTARRRSSVRRHARLLDYAMHDGCNARAWIQFELAGAGDGIVVPSRDPVTQTPTRVLTKVPEPPVVAEERLARIVSDHAPEIFELMHGVTLYRAHNQIELYTWSDDACCLPAGATRATLRDGDPRLRLRTGDVLVFVERLDPETGQAADADPAHRHAVRLTSVEPEATVDANGARTPAAELVDRLTGEAIVRIAWDAADALPFPLCISTEAHANVSVALGNVALVDHGRRILDETLPTVLSFKHRLYRPRLDHRDITFAEPVPAAALLGPAAAALDQDPRVVLPVVELEHGDHHWMPRRDLLASDRFEAHFVVETEDDARAYLRFAAEGDDHGLPPPVERDRAPDQQPTLVATYRIGNGTAGNVGADAISHVVVPDPGSLHGVTRVRNPLPARGGIDPESTERVRLDAPQAFRVQQRAVTEQDYADVAARHPEVQRAVATRRWTGSWHTMFLTVDRAGGRPVDDGFEAEIADFLSQFRLAGHDLEIEPPQFVPVEIVMTVCVAPGYFAEDVRLALFEAFSMRERPDGTRGFFHPDNFTFGDPVYVSKVVATAMKIPGVMWVDLTDRGEGPNRFRRFGEASRGEWERGRIDVGRLEIVQLDNDPNAPENGRIEFLMEGGA